MRTVCFTMYAVFSYVRFCCCSALSSSMSCLPTHTAFYFSDCRMIGVVFASSAMNPVWACILPIICFSTVDTSKSLYCYSAAAGHKVVDFVEFAAEHDEIVDFVEVVVLCSTVC